MNFAKQTILRISLSLALALSLVSGDVAQADPPSPLPCPIRPLQPPFPEHVRKFAGRGAELDPVPDQL